MAIRVTQGIMYNSFITNMNSTLSAYMESNIQSSSQKRVNRPSDDPVSAGRILDTRNTLSRLSIYEDNIKTAMGWLNLADNMLASGDGSVHTLLSLIKSKDIQTSTGTINQDNREQVASEIREMLAQLVSLANTRYGDQHIFAGHKTDQAPYSLALGVTVKDPDGGLDGVKYNVEGASESTIIITPVTSDTAGNAEYMFSRDGGKTWAQVAGVTVNASGSCTIDTGVGVTVEISDASGTVTAAYSAAELQNPDDIIKTSEGSWLYVRPTAVYTGDDDSTQVTSTYFNSGANANLKGTAEGHFTRDVAVRLDSLDSSATPPMLGYSYSTDNGSTWTTATAPLSGSEPTLPVPGGYLKLSEPPTTADMGTQFVIHPRRADIDFQIGEKDTITVNMVGKDIFGGLYNDPGSDYPYAEPVAGVNMFETLGKLVAALESNDQEMVQGCLDELDQVMNLVRTRAAEVGGRENRLIVSQAAIVMRTYTEEDYLSQIEDVDVTELMTRLAQQQIAYNSVLKSSSMIMQMSLVNFL